MLDSIKQKNKKYIIYYMKTFKINDREFKLKDSYDDWTIETFIEFNKLNDQHKVLQLEDLYFLKLLEVLCGVESGELDDMTLEDFTEITKELTYLSDTPKFDEKTPYYDMDGVTYVIPRNFNLLTAGEKISIDTLNYERDQYDAWLNILSILVRPGVEIKDPETGKSIWIRNKFDANNIEYRKSLFKKAPFLLFYPVVTFFLFGNKISLNNFQDFIPEKK